eukprot:3320210-Rhodomonas_salina.1
MDGDNCQNGRCSRSRLKTIDADADRIGVHKRGAERGMHGESPRCTASVDRNSASFMAVLSRQPFDPTQALTCVCLGGQVPLWPAAKAESASTLATL